MTHPTEPGTGAQPTSRVPSAGGTVTLAALHLAVARVLNAASVALAVAGLAVVALMFLQYLARDAAPGAWPHQGWYAAVPLWAAALVLNLRGNSAARKGGVDPVETRAWWR